MLGVEIFTLVKYEPDNLGSKPIKLELEPQPEHFPLFPQPQNLKHFILKIIYFANTVKYRKPSPSVPWGIRFLDIVGSLVTQGGPLIEHIFRNEKNQIKICSLNFKRQSNIKR